MICFLVPVLAELFLLGYLAIVVIAGYKIYFKKNKTLLVSEVQLKAGWKWTRFDSWKKESKLREIHI